MLPKALLGSIILLGSVRLARRVIEHSVNDSGRFFDSDTPHIIIASGGAATQGNLPKDVIGSIKGLIETTSEKPRDLS